MGSQKLWDFLFERLEAKIRENPKVISDKTLFFMDFDANLSHTLHLHEHQNKFIWQVLIQFWLQNMQLIEARTINPKVNINKMCHYVVAMTLNKVKSP